MKSIHCLRLLANRHHWFRGSASEPTELQALPAEGYETPICCEVPTRQSLKCSAFPGRAWERVFCRWRSARSVHYLLLFSLAAFSSNPFVGMVVATDATTISRWNPHEFTFHADAVPPNPYMVEFSATATGPNGITISLPGYYDGNGNWKIRLAPTVEGKWSITTKSELPELDAKKLTFSSVTNANPNVHGVLRVDKNHPHHFIYEDETRFFMQAYEYDWLWALDVGKPDVPTIGKSLDLLAEHNFNYIILNTYAHDTKWRKGKSETDDYGPPTLYPWAGSNESPDHRRMNLDFWQHYDRVMTAMLERGMVAHVFIKVYNKDVKWPERDSAEEKLFFRWLIARYAAYPNIIWDFSKEAHNEKNLAYKQNWLRYLRENDPYHHLVTVHDDDVANDKGEYDTLTDFRTDQHHVDQKGRSDHDTILFQRQRRAWPVANVESDYECGLDGIQDKTYGKAMTPEATVQTLWNIAMAGGYTGYYYTYTAWDVIRPMDVPKGYMYMKHFGDFWRATEYWKLEPADALVSTGFCMAQPGREYVVFQKQALPFTLKITEATSDMTGEWFHPLTGKRIAAGAFRNGTVTLTPPTHPDSAPIVLHIKVK